MKLQRAQERFWSKVDKNGPIARVELGRCWVWLAGKNSAGYGCIWIDGKMQLAHRVAFVFVRGNIGEPQIDHLCRNRACVNPAHLEPVTSATNTARGLAGAHERAKTHCPQGHEYSAENTYIAPVRASSKALRRFCRTCNRVRRRVSAEAA